MKANIPVEFSERDRQAIARFLGRDGLATHIECVAWAKQQVIGSLAVMALTRPLPHPGSSSIVSSTARDLAHGPRGCL